MHATFQGLSENWHGLELRGKVTGAVRPFREGEWRPREMAERMVQVKLDRPLWKQLETAGVLEILRAAVTGGTQTQRLLCAKYRR
jgi:hypothetical protein